PGIATLEKAARNPDDHRRREAVARAPAHGAAVIQLLGRRISVLAELDLRDGQQAREREADGTADDALLRETRIEDARLAVFLLQAEGRAVHASLGTHVFTEDHHPGVEAELDIERAADCRQHVDARRLRPWPAARRREGKAHRREAALLLQRRR